MFCPTDEIIAPFWHNWSGISNVPVKIPVDGPVSTSENPVADKLVANPPVVPVLESTGAPVLFVKHDAVFCGVNGLLSGVFDHRTLAWPNCTSTSLPNALPSEYCTRPALPIVSVALSWLVVLMEPDGF